jgi:hypothetical protein
LNSTLKATYLDSYMGVKLLRLEESNWFANSLLDTKHHIHCINFSAMRIQNHVWCVVEIIVLASCSIYLNIDYKINVTISITYLDCTPILEWCVEDVDLRMKTMETCLYNGLDCVLKFVIYSRFKSQQQLKPLLGHIYGFGTLDFEKSYQHLIEQIKSSLACC